MGLFGGKKEKINKLKVWTNHEYGLPIPKGVDCSIQWEGDKVTFTYGNSQFNLSIDKITDISTCTDVEMQEMYVSSIGGAIVGEALLGPAGAVIGGRSKPRTTKTETHFIVFSYIKDQETQFISCKIPNDWQHLEMARKICRAHMALVRDKVPTETEL